MLASVVLAQVSIIGADPGQDALAELDDLTYVDARPGCDVQFQLMVRLVWSKHAGNTAVSIPRWANAGDFIGMASRVRKTVPDGKANPAGW